MVTARCHGCMPRNASGRPATITCTPADRVGSSRSRPGPASPIDSIPSTSSSPRPAGVQPANSATEPITALAALPVHAAGSAASTTMFASGTLDLAAAAIVRRAVVRPLPAGPATTACMPGPSARVATLRSR